MNHMLQLVIVCLLLINLNKSEDDDVWTVYYWDLKNRGNFVRLLFEWKGVAYKDVTDYEEFKQHFAAWDDSVFDLKSNIDKHHSPMFAPPGIKYENKADLETGGQPIFLSQTATVVSFVSNKLGILPIAGTLQDYQAQKIVLDCFDISTEFYRLAGGGDYRGYSLSNIQDYIDQRFEKWMRLIEYPLLKGNTKYYFGNKNDEITYADLAVFNVINGIEQLFPTNHFNKFIKQKHRKLYQLYQSISQIDQIKKFISKQDHIGVEWFDGEKIVAPIQQSLPQIDEKNEL